MKTTTPHPCLDVLRAGLLPWEEAYRLQLKLHAEREAGRIRDTLILVEHPHVFTLGKRGTDGDIIWPEQVRLTRGVQTVVTDRGGQATYHGPGQLVGYLVLDLGQNARRMRQFIFSLEKRIAGYLQDAYGLAAKHDGPEPGIWIGKRKICAIGISVRNRVTMHGFALNVCPDLTYFMGIIPCGISDSAFGITSLARELGIEGGLPAGNSDADSPTLRQLYENCLTGVAEAFGTEPLLR